jgi:hypothetical protein
VTRGIATINENAVSSLKADNVLIQSSPGNSPFQVHLFVHDKRLVAARVVEWKECRVTTGKEASLPQTIAKRFASVTPHRMIVVLLVHFDPMNAGGKARAL